MLHTCETILEVTRSHFNQKHCTMFLRVNSHLPVRCSSGPPWPPSSSSSSPSTNPLGKVLLFFLFSCLTIQYTAIRFLFLVQILTNKSTCHLYKSRKENNKLIKFLLTCEGTFFGGSIRMDGSHSPGGRTVTWSRNSSIPAIRSLRSLAL